MGTRVGEGFEEKGFWPWWDCVIDDGDRDESEGKRDGGRRHCRLKT